MRKTIDKNLEKRFNGLFKEYPLFSREEDLVSKVRFWIEQTANSLIPDSPLAVAEGHIDSYQYITKGNTNNYLIEQLRKIVENAYDIYCDKVEGVVIK